MDITKYSQDVRFDAQNLSKFVNLEINSVVEAPGILSETIFDRKDERRPERGAIYKVQMGTRQNGTAIGIIIFLMSCAFS